jgi:hypothetical protein
MLDASPPRQAEPTDLSTYPREGFRIGINHHKETIGHHRLRLSFPAEFGDILRRGLYTPRLHIDGTAINGLRIWCEQDGGLSPVINRSSGTWSASLPARRIRARETFVTSMDVAVQWQLDETGPVLLIPRLPDALLPENVIDKLPNSQVDPETRFDRAEKRLQREMQNLYANAMTLEDEASDQAELSAKQAWSEDRSPIEPEPAQAPAEAPPIEPPATEAPPMDPAPVDPPSPPAADLKTALAMVNELVDQLGDSVVLSIDERGHVTAKRRVVQFIDL